MSKNLFRIGIAIILATVWLSFGLGSSNASDRGAAFAAQMRLLPASVLAKLPSDPKVLVDKMEKLTGELEVVSECDGKNSRLLYFLKTDTGSRQVYFSAEPSEELRTGIRVSFDGVRAGDGLAADVTSLEVAATSNLQVLTNTFGDQKTLVILVNFQDEQTQPFTPDQARDVAFNTTSNYYREASFGQTWLTGDVYGWFTIPISSTTCDKTAIANYALQAATNAGANLDAYNHYVYAFPSNACSFTGSATVGGSPSQAWINAWFELGVLGHEFGHNLGLYHSRSMDCGTVVIGGTCTVTEYGDTLDLIGGASSAHFNLFQKERLGWLNYGGSPPLQTVSANGTYWLDSAEPVGTAAKGLKILKSTDPVTGQRTWYYIEHRSAIGFDGFLSGNPNVLGGVVIHTGSEANPQDIYLLDMTPETASWDDPALTVGHSFTDSGAGVTFTTLSADSTGSLVQIDFGQQSCTPGNPSVTVSPGQSPWLRAGTSYSYTVTVQNNSSRGCSATNFSLGAGTAAGWTGTYLSPTLSIGPGGNASTTLYLASPVDAFDGLYNVGVSAVDNSNPGYSGSSAAGYTIVSGLTVGVASGLAKYRRTQTATVTATIKALASAVAGADVTFTMTRPDGSIVTQNAVSASNGNAVFSYVFDRRRDPLGTYKVRAVASANGVAGKGETSFLVYK